tara:strand:- start:304 stop:459 length:156 start_codon:yes stop_codon:yes gene_type:complete
LVIIPPDFTFSGDFIPMALMLRLKQKSTNSGIADNAFLINHTIYRLKFFLV